KAQLLSIGVPSAGATFGLHPNLIRLQSLWQQHHLAVVTNVGPLVVPLTRQQYLSNAAPKPYQLFSHPDQQTEMQSGYATKSTPSSPLLVQEAADVGTRLLSDSAALSTDPPIATAFPNTSLGNQLKQAAKLMALRGALGLERQIFFCSIGGFDTHSGQGVAAG